MGADNITLDLNGHRLSGPKSDDGTSAGIHLTKRSGVTVKAGEVSGFAAGVAIVGGSGNTVKNMKIHDNVGARDPSTSIFGDGVAVFFSADNRILDNTITSNAPFDGIAILGIGSDRNLVQGNSVTATKNLGDASGPVGLGIIINPFLGFDLPREVSLVSNQVVANTVRNNDNTGISTLSNIEGLVKDNVVEGNGLGKAGGSYPFPAPTGSWSALTGTKSPTMTPQATTLRGTAGTTCATRTTIPPPTSRTATPMSGQFSSPASLGGLRPGENGRSTATWGGLMRLVAGRPAGPAARRRVRSTFGAVCAPFVPHTPVRSPARRRGDAPNPVQTSFSGRDGCRSSNAIFHLLSSLTPLAPARLTRAISSSVKRRMPFWVFADPFRRRM